MLLNRLNWNRLTLGLSLVIFIVTVPAHSDERVQYFGKGIDYWHEQNAQSTQIEVPHSFVTTSAPESGTKPEPAPSEGQFPWQKYLDPKNKEFFKEGDYTPPEPFMEIVRDPSDSNLKLWFDYISKKNQLSDRLQLKMREYLEKTGAAIPSDEGDKVFARVSRTQVRALDSHRYRFRLYFDSHCPHCRRMFGTLSELQLRGYYVEARQVDQDVSELQGLSIPVEKAQAAEIQEKNIQSVPVLLIGDLKRKLVYRVTGYQTTSQVLGAIPKE
jgi:hypothetical protein